MRGIVRTLIISKEDREGRDGSLSSLSNPPHGTNLRTQALDSASLKGDEHGQQLELSQRLTAMPEGHEGVGNGGKKGMRDGDQRRGAKC